MTLEFENEYQGGTMGFDPEETARMVIDAALDYEDFPYEAEVSLTLTDNEGIWKLNKEFRNMDRPTDVLSFPLISYESAGNFDELSNNDDCFNPETGEAVLGDIVISVDKVKEQAESYGHSLRREYSFLIAHSMLHLMGYDHMKPEEAEIMEKKQSEILEGLGITRVTDEELINEAEKAKEFACVPYSKFKVGAAILTKSGRIYTGCNIENSSFGATICAERTAAVKAISSGDREFVRIAVVSSSGDVTYPCGICRQFLSDFMSDGAEMVFHDKNGKIIALPFKDIYPYSFTKGSF